MQYHITNQQLQSLIQKKEYFPKDKQHKNTFAPHSHKTIPEPNAQKLFYNLVPSIHSSVLEPNLLLKPDF